MKIFSKQALLGLVVMVLISSPVAPQSNGENGAQLIESGKAEKIVEPPSSGELKIVSYNIRWRSGKELQEIIRWLKDAGDSRPAIIGLQEVDRARKRSGRLNHAKALADSLGLYYAWAAPHQPKSETREEEAGVVILSPYPLDDVTRIVLPNPGPGGRLRVAIGATMNLSEPPASAGGSRPSAVRQVRVYSVHSETRIANAKKVEQLRAVLDDLARHPKIEAAIVLGDFNAWESPAIEGIRKLFTNAGFSTPFPDNESTFCRKIVMFDLKLKLDWIWVRGMTPTSYGIERSLKVSDHFPLWVIVKTGADNQ